MRIEAIGPNYLCYTHTKPDGEVFYVGIGNRKRPYRKDRRSNLWNNIAKKYGYTIEILSENLTWEDACALERQLISKIGRRDLGKGTLVNHTDGGDGTINMSREAIERSAAKHRGIPTWNKGLKTSNETKLKSSISHLGNSHSVETCNKISVNHRKSNTEESKDKVRKFMLNAPKTPCANCGKLMNKNNYASHFEKCSGMSNKILTKPLSRGSVLIDQL